MREDTALSFHHDIGQVNAPIKEEADDTLFPALFLKLFPQLSPQHLLCSLDLVFINYFA